VDEESLRMDMLSPSTPTCRKPRLLTQKLLDAHEHVGVSRSSVSASIPPRRYDNHIALTSSICELSTYFKELKCDALMEECDVWWTVPFQDPVVDCEIATVSYLQLASLFDL
jgi:hypothetical protein